MIGKAYIKDNGKGSIYSILETDGETLLVLEVEQIGYNIDPNTHRGKKEVRRGEIVGTVEEMIRYAVEPGEILFGNIVIKESLEPPIPDDPEALLYWNKKGTKVLKTPKGEPIYRYSYYTENIEEKDELLSW